MGCWGAEDDIPDGQDFLSGIDGFVTSEAERAVSGIDNVGLTAVAMADELNDTNRLVDPIANGGEEVAWIAVGNVFPLRIVALAVESLWRRGRGSYGVPC